MGKKNRQNFGFANTEKKEQKMRGEQQKIDNRNFELQILSIRIDKSVRDLLLGFIRFLGQFKMLCWLSKASRFG
jgi:hypothetical protein